MYVNKFSHRYSVKRRKVKKKREEICFSECADIWISEIKRDVKESTYSRYMSITEKKIKPYFKNIFPSEIDCNLINNFSAKMRENGGKDGKSLSVKTVCDIVTVLKQIIKFCNVRGYSQVDLAGVKKPKRKKANIKTLNNDDFNKMIELLTSKNDGLSLGILFSLFTGIRIGELCGLRWGDIDFNEETVRINRTVERISDLTPGAVKKTKVVFQKPKTESSGRIIPLPKGFIQYLKNTGKDTGYFLVTGSEKYCEPHTLYVRYTRFLKRNGFPKYTFHTLRHTFATKCAETGFEIKALSEILGHSDISTTLRCYIHPSMEQKREQMEMVYNSKYEGLN